MSTNKKIPFWATLGHGKPVTRRDFLATGLIPFSAWAVAPSLVQLLASSQAEAQTADCLQSSTGMIPFITINLAGGPSLASQLALRRLDGEYLGLGYRRIGLGSGPNKSFKPVVEFGGVEFSGPAVGATTTIPTSKFLHGMRTTQSNAIATEGLPRNPALDKTAFLYMPASSTDDSSDNPFDVTGAVVKMGLAGSKLQNLGTSGTLTGISQKSALTPPPAPFVVRKLDDLTGALGYTSSLLAKKDDGSDTRINLTDQQKQSLAKLVGNLSSSQVRKLASVPGTESLQQMLSCLGVKNADLIKGKGGDVNPFAGPMAGPLNNIWETNNSVIAALVYNGLQGNAATININLGGYDYHNGSRTLGNTKDFEAGVIVGKILKTAELLKKKCFIYVCADGATTSTQTDDVTGAWMSDRGIAGVLYMFLYDPAKRPVIVDNIKFPNQIGGFTDGEAADGEFITGNNPIMSASGVFANYAAWNNQFDYLEKNRILNDVDTRKKVIRVKS